MQVVGDVKCYHCGHISGQVLGTRTDRLVLEKFMPRPGYQGQPYRPGQRLQCERCQGPVFLEDLRSAPPLAFSVLEPATRKRGRSSREKAA